MESCRATVNIVGVGNTFMGDDGVGVAVIEALERRGAPAGVCLFDAGLAVSDVLGMLDPSQPLIVIDAVRGGGRPGELHRVKLEDVPPEEGGFPGRLSLHEISVAPALNIEALGGREFQDVTIIGVEPERIAWGEGLSPAVAEAVGRVVELVLEEAETRQAKPAHIGTGKAYL